MSGQARRVGLLGTGTWTSDWLLALIWGGVVVRVVLWRTARLVWRYAQRPTHADLGYRASMTEESRRSALRSATGISRSIRSLAFGGVSCKTWSTGRISTAFTRSTIPRVNGCGRSVASGACITGRMRYVRRHGATARSALTMRSQTGSSCVGRRKWRSPGWPRCRACHDRRPCGIAMPRLLTSSQAVLRTYAFTGSTTCQVSHIVSGASGGKMEPSRQRRWIDLSTFVGRGPRAQNQPVSQSARIVRGALSSLSPPKRRLPRCLSSMPHWASTLEF